MSIVEGIDVAEIDIPSLVRLIDSWIGSGEQHVAVGVNAHVVNLAARDKRFSDIVARADLRYADGQSVVWVARARGGNVPARVATTDLVRPLAEMCATRGHSMFFFGSRPGVAERAAQRLGGLVPGLVVDSHHGYVEEVDMPALLEKIRAVQPDILLVGLGDPLQQVWIDRHRAELGVPVLLSCGGLFDWISGDNRRPPGWMVRAGLEWLWRMILEPRRLARRYLVGNPEFVARVVMDTVRHRRHP